MRAAHATLYQYSIPFTEPVTVKGRRLTGRDGLLLALKNQDGQLVGYGEIAPLPGLHSETLEAAEGQLVALLSEHDFSRSGKLPLKLYPSVRTGVEMAMINLDAAEAGGTLPFTALPPEARQGSQLPNVPLNGLLFGDTMQVLERADKLFRAGYRAFKLKVTATNLPVSAETIIELHRAYGSGIELRLDLNQSLSLDEAVAFARTIPLDSVAYIEEPLKQPELIGEFHDRTGILSALDETLWQQPELLEKLPRESLQALILKPNRIGGIYAAMSLAALALEKNLLAVFSSAFESGVSLGFYAMLAAAASPTPAACGLDTFRYLKHDLLETPFGSKNARLDAEALYGNSLAVDRQMIRQESRWTL
ncbi:MAG: o-succinylbenzoate synthase [Chlorobiaceae bacterium]